MRTAAGKPRLNSANGDLYSLAKTKIGADFHAVTAEWTAPAEQFATLAPDTISSPAWVRREPLI